MAVARPKTKAGKCFLNAEIDRDLRDRITAVAKLEGTTVPELLDKILRPELQKRIVSSAATA